MRNKYKLAKIIYQNLELAIMLHLDEEPIEVVKGEFKMIGNL